MAGAAAALLVALGAVGLTATATATAAPAVSRLTFLGQSTVVRPGGTFDLNLGVPAAAAGDQLQVGFLPALTARTTFDQDAAGNFVGYPTQDDTVPLSALPSGPGGGVLARIPINRAAKGHELAPFSAGPASTVYPLRVQLLDAAGTPVGKPLATFLVFDGGTVGFARLAVSLIVPFGAAPAVGAAGEATPLPAAVVARLAAEVQALGSGSGLPLSLAATPQTLDALAGGDAAARSVASGLTGLVSGGDQVLPGTYVATSPSSLEASGLGDQLAPQVAAGLAALRRHTGTSPSPSTWAVDGHLDPATLGALQAEGLRRLILPAADLSALPAILQNTTFARPATLGKGAQAVEVYGADPILSGRMGQHSSPVLAADVDLAELAMIQLETPSLQRGVAIFAPGDVSDAWLQAFLSGLRGDPFAAAVTADGLFSRVPRLPANQGGPTQNLLPIRPAALPGAGGLAALDGSLGELADVAPAASDLLGPLGERLLVAESSELAPTVRGAIVAGATRAIAKVLDAITLPAAMSVTLTSSSAAIPVTFGSDPAVAVHLQLVFSSSKLSFKRIHPAGGTCQVVTAQASEICNLVVRAATVTIKVPVVSRTSGVFPLDVSLLSPGGSVLATQRDTIRSTAVSWVGLVLMVGAGLFLAVWWVHNIRHGRRAGGLVPPPDDDPGDGGGQGGCGPDDLTPAPPPSTPPKVPEPWVLDDPVVARFFASPQPEMSPSQDPVGPSVR